MTPQIHDADARLEGTRSALISFALCSTVVATCLLTDHRYHHWFVIPLLICGTLISIDAVDWMRGRLDLFDPIGVLGALGCYFFFISPLLCIPFGTTLDYCVTPADFREWLGRMAVLNIGSILAYLTSRDWIVRRNLVSSRRWRWTLEVNTCSAVLWSLMILSVVLQVLVYVRYGGIGGYISENLSGPQSFAGMGWVFMLSEPLPVLATITYSVSCRRSGRTPGWLELTALLLAILTLQVFFGGLRGSRSETVWVLFWAGGIIHLIVRPIPRPLVVAGLLGLGLFMYAYGFYKSHGREGWRALTSAAARERMSQEGQRDLSTLLIADLSRCDVQAYLLYRLTAPSTVSDYRLAYGRTYLLAATLPIPNRLLWFEPTSKNSFGTEAEYGRGSYHPGEWQSSRVYGIGGETMLNFGPAAVPFGYLVLGLVVGFAKRCFDQWDRADMRVFLLPFLINLCFVVLVGDSDNVVFFLVKDGAVFILAIVLISRMWSPVTSLPQPSAGPSDPAIPLFPLLRDDG